MNSYMLEVINEYQNAVREDIEAKQNLVKAESNSSLDTGAGIAYLDAVQTLTDAKATVVATDLTVSMYELILNSVALSLSGS